MDTTKFALTDPAHGAELGSGDDSPRETFLQPAGGCGTAFLSRLTPDGHTTRVNGGSVTEAIPFGRN
jgi:hypothetical protein